MPLHQAQGLRTWCRHPLTNSTGFFTKLVVNTFRLRIILTSLGSVLLLTSIATSLGAEAPATFKVGEFSFKRPASWEWVESSSPMRKAQLKIADAAQKESAEVVFFYFGEGGGGGTKANVDRWLGLFQEPREKLQSKVEEVTVNQRRITYVQAQGTYMSGMPGGAKTPQPDTMLLGAILESPAGSVFVRLTGPLKLSTASQTAFRKMVEGDSNK